MVSIATTLRDRWIIKRNFCPCFCRPARFTVSVAQGARTCCVGVRMHAGPGVALFDDPKDRRVMSHEENACNSCCVDSAGVKINHLCLFLTHYSLQIYLDCLK